MLLCFLCFGSYPSPVSQMPPDLSFLFTFLQHKQSCKGSSTTSLHPSHPGWTVSIIWPNPVFLPWTPPTFPQYPTLTPDVVLSVMPFPSAKTFTPPSVYLLKSYRLSLPVVNFILSRKLCCLDCWQATLTSFCPRWVTCRLMPLTVSGFSPCVS